MACVGPMSDEKHGEPVLYMLHISRTRDISRDYLRSLLVQQLSWTSKRWTPSNEQLEWRKS